MRSKKPVPHPALEVGGEFHWIGLSAGSRLTWPAPAAWFALGRGALATAWKQSPTASPSGQLWVPDYFCPDVTKFLHQTRKVRCYADDPRWPNPDWDTLRPDPGDLVLAVDYFGIRSGNPWRAWHACHDDIVLVEDHTHDPWSTWAINSSADYAFASVRKICPVTDGAILWSPRQQQLPPSPASGDLSGSALKLAAMVLKADYLTGRSGPNVKGLFREWQVTGEAQLVNSGGPGVSPWSRAMIASGIPTEWRSRRERNTREFLQSVTRCDLMAPLFHDWPKGHVPFNPVVLFPSASIRDDFRQRLISEGIYCPVHWMAAPDSPSHVADLASRILTIPVDQRYGAPQVSRVVATLDRMIEGRRC